MNSDNGLAKIGEQVLESIVLRGDLSGLSPTQRARFYVQTCEALGLNPHSQPFAYLKLNGKEVLYATRGATDQLAAMHKLNREIIDGPKIIDLAGTKVVYCVARATHPNGRTETATATVPFVDPVNVLMKCETKSKRRVTLSILGLGVLDETEVETIPAQEKELTAQVTRADIDAVRSLPSGAVKSTSIADLDNVSRPITRKSESPRPYAFDVFAEALRKATSLVSVVALWHEHAQALHHDGTEGSADGLVSAWLEDHGHVLTATEQQTMLARGYTPDALLALDGIAELKSPDDVVTWRIRGDAHLAQLGEPSASAVKMGAARRWAHLAGVTTKKPGVAFGEAVKRAMTPPPDHDPPTGTDGPARPGAANDTSATSTPVAHGATPASAPQALDVVDAPDARSDGGDDLSTRAARRKHLGAKHCERAVVASYAAHSGLPHYLDDCTARLAEIVAPDGTRLSELTARKRLVDARNKSLTKPAQGAARRAA